MYKIAQDRSATSYQGGTAMAEDLTRYGLGARGIDLVERKPYNGSWTTEFPIYDAHGNNIARLKRSGSNGYTVSNLRSYDAWGSVRSGVPSGNPTQRYCANLGHLQDDESGLVYMRARYYEPATGRFISEDPAMDGLNWYVYCGNDPVSRVDSTGNADAPQPRPGHEAIYQFYIGAGYASATLGMVLSIGAKTPGRRFTAMLMFCAAMGAFGQALGQTSFSSPTWLDTCGMGAWIVGFSALLVEASDKGHKAARGYAYAAIAASITYDCMLVAALVGAINGE